MKLDKMEVFCAVARNLSFSKAAEECHIAQSAISQQIRQLEEELGFLLFERSTRRVNITEAGQSLYDDCVRIMESLENATIRATAISAGKRSTLTVGIEGLIQADVRVAAIQRFERAHREIQVVPKQLDPNEKYSQLVSGEVDLVFDLPRYYSLNHSITAVGQVKNEHVVMVSRSHPLAGERRVSKQRLAEFTTFLGGISSVESYLMQQYVEYLRTDGISTRKVIYVPNQDVATMMVALNQGCNILPRMRTHWWSEETFAFVELEEPFYIESAWLYSRKNENPALRDFVEMIRKESEATEA